MTAAPERYLLVQAGQQVCALPLARLRRVERSLALHPLPGARPELLGLAELGGEPLAVLDLARLIEAPPGTAPARGVTVVAWAGPEGEREAVGLAADAALEIVAMPADPLVADVGGIVRGEALVGGRLVRVLALERLGAEAR